MLDAAHREGVSTIVVRYRAHIRRVEVQATGIDTARRRGRRPAETLRADIVQGSRRVDAVARGNHIT